MTRELDDILAGEYGGNYSKHIHQLPNKRKKIDEDLDFLRTDGHLRRKLGLDQHKPPVKRGKHVKLN